MSGAKGETGAAPASPPATADSRPGAAPPPAAAAGRSVGQAESGDSRAGAAAPPRPASASPAAGAAPALVDRRSAAAVPPPGGVERRAAPAGARPASEGAASGPTPFWRRAPRLLVFPLQRTPLLFNLAGAAAATVLAYVLVDPNLPLSLASLGVLLLVFCAGTFVAGFYAFSVLEHSATGYLDPAAYPPGRRTVDLARPAKVFALLVAVPVAVGVVAVLAPPIVGRVLWLLAALVLPAMTVVMVQTDSFAEALDPSRLIKTVLAIGAPYAMLCLFLLAADACVDYFAVDGARAVTTVHLAPPPEGARRGAAPVIRHDTLSMGSFSGFFLGLGLFVNYLLLLAGALLGYVMFQYSEGLGVQVVGPGEARVKGGLSAAAHARRRREAMIAQMIARGEIAEAIGLLNADLSERPTDMALHARLHELLLLEGSGPKIETHAARYLDLLLGASNTREGLALYEKTRAQFPTFTPREPACLPLLAREALGAGRPEVAAELVRGFDKRYALHPQIPDAYVIGARVLLLGGQSEQARKLLKHVVATYPASPATAEAKRYLERFEKKPAA